MLAVRARRYITVFAVTKDCIWQKVVPNKRDKLVLPVAPDPTPKLVSAIGALILVLCKEFLLQLRGRLLQLALASISLA